MPASVYGFERQTVRRGLPLYEGPRQKLRALSAVLADEPSWLDDGRAAWVWYAGSAQLAFFHLDRHRTTEAVPTVLDEQFDGIILAVAFASYKGVNARDWQSCLAHIKNKAKELEQDRALLKDQAVDPQALQFCRQVQSFVHLSCQAHQRFCRSRWRAKTAHRQARARRLGSLTR